VAWLQQWAAHEAKTQADATAGAGAESGGGRFRPRVVVVTNLGASNVKANDAIARCLASDLPDAVKALVQLCPPPAASSPSAAGMGHRLVLLTQPLRHTVLEGRVSPAHAAKVRQSQDN